MKTLSHKIGLYFLLTVCMMTLTHAQYIEDALRLGAPGLSVGARSLGLGTAYTGIANDFSAVYWNPAGLGQMRLNEFSIGLSNLSYGNTSTYYGAEQHTSNSSTTLNSAGLVYVAPTVKGSLVVALGYGRQTDFTTGLSFKGFNPQSSIIQSWAADGAPYPPDVTLAERLALATADTISGRFISPINDSLTQSGKVLEGGGLNYYSAAASIEAVKNVFLGLTLNFISGSYSFTRNYYEDDLKNIYDASRYPYDVSSISLSDNLETSLSGFTMKFGFLYTPTPQSKIGLTIKSPSWVTARETFTSVATSDFDNGDHFIFPTGEFAPSTNEYDVRTPYAFSGGFSFNENIVTLATDLEYTDWTQMEFSSSGAYSSTFDNYLNDLNQQIKETMQSTLNARIGLEVAVPNTDMSLRGGFAYLPSPYQFDSSPNAQKYVTAGIGFNFDNSIALDLGYAHGFWETSHIVYSGVDKNRQSFSAATSEQIRTNNFMATFAYRF